MKQAVKPREELKELNFGQRLSNLEEIVTKKKAYWITKRRQIIIIFTNTKKVELEITNMKEKMKQATENRKVMIEGKHTPIKKKLEIERTQA